MGAGAMATENLYKKIDAEAENAVRCRGKKKEKLKWIFPIK